MNVEVVCSVDIWKYNFLFDLSLSDTQNNCGKPSYIMSVNCYDWEYEFLEYFVCHNRYPFLQISLMLSLGFVFSVRAYKFKWSKMQISMFYSCIIRCKFFLTEYGHCYLDWSGGSSSKIEVSLLSSKLVLSARGWNLDSNATRTESIGVPKLKICKVKPMVNP